MTKEVEKVINSWLKEEGVKPVPKEEKKVEVQPTISKSYTLSNLEIFRKKKSEAAKKLANDKIEEKVMIGITAVILWIIITPIIAILGYIGINILWKLFEVMQPIFDSIDKFFG
jgi:hypothetical protein